MPESFVFYDSYLKGIEYQDEESQNRLFLALCRYALRGEEPSELNRSELGIFELMRPTVDANSQRREASKKGGAPNKGRTHAKEPTVIENCENEKPTVIENCEIEKPTVIEKCENEKPTVIENCEKEKPTVIENCEIEKPNENENETENENGNGNGTKTEKTNEKALQDYTSVELSDEETAELERLSDSLSVKAYINKLSLWQQQNRKKSVKAYSVIKGWIMQDKPAKTADNTPKESYSINILDLIARDKDFVRLNRD